MDFYRKKRPPINTLGHRLSTPDDYSADTSQDGSAMQTADDRLVKKKDLQFTSPDRSFWNSRLKRRLDMEAPACPNEENSNCLNETAGQLARLKKMRASRKHLMACGNFFDVIERMHAHILNVNQYSIERRALREWLSRPNRRGTSELLRDLFLKPGYSFLRQRYEEERLPSPTPFRRKSVLNLRCGT